MEFDFRDSDIYHPLLAGYVGEMVNIHYDPRDLAEINVYYRDKFLCLCICQDMSAMVVNLKEIQTARNAFKQELSGEIKKAKNFINAIRQGRYQMQNRKRKLREQSILNFIARIDDQVAATYPAIKLLKQRVIRGLSILWKRVEITGILESATEIPGAENLLLLKTI